MEFAINIWCSDKQAISAYRIIYGLIGKFTIWVVYQRRFGASEAEIGDKNEFLHSEPFHEHRTGPKGFRPILLCKHDAFWSQSTLRSPKSGLPMRLWQICHWICHGSKTCAYQLTSTQYWLPMIQRVLVHRFNRIRSIPQLLHCDKKAKSPVTNLSRFLSRDKRVLWVDLTCRNAPIW